MANKDLTIRIKVQDGQAKVQIEQIGKGFMNAKNAADLFRQAIKDQNSILKGSVADYQRQIANLKLIRNNSAKTAEEFKRQTKAINQLQIKMRALTVDTGDLNKVNQDQISNAGLAGATLTELGRTVSDLPYGIRGVANNLSQLSTLFITLVSKTDGVTNSFKLLRTQLAGPLGLILAFQGVIAALDFFSQKSDEAKDKTDDLTDSIESEIQKVKVLTGELGLLETQLIKTLGFRPAGGIEETFIAKLTGDDLTKAVKRLRNEFNEFDKMFETLDDFSEKTVNALINDFVSLLEVRKEQQQIEEQLEELRKQEVRDYIAEQFLSGQLILLREKEFDLTEKYIDQTIERNRVGEAYFKAENKRIEDLDRAILDSMLFQDPDDPNVPFYGDADMLDMAFMGFDQFMSKYISKTEEGIDAREKAALDEFEIQAKELEGLIDYEKEKQKILDYYDALRQKSRNDEAKRMNETIKQLTAIYESFKQASDALFDAEISREERRTALRNNELKKQLKNEQLTAQQREAINNQIATNEENLDRKRDKIAERQFKIQKALMIGEALVTTYKMANSAYEAVLASPLKFLGLGALVQAKIAAGIATAFGLANVAAISRQQFVPSAIGGAGGGGAGGAGGGMQAPDFNIVGASAQSQLAETVATAESQPVRAYVVGKDVSTQQELDRNITNTASFG